MNQNKPRESPPQIALLAICLIVIGLGLFWVWRRHREGGNNQRETTNALPPAKPPSGSPAPRSLSRTGSDSAEAPSSAEAIVAKKLTLFAQKQRAVFEAMASQHNVAVPDEVKRFFAAIEAGHWEEADALFKAMVDPNYPSGSPSDDIKPFWRPIQETWGAARMAQRMPAQQFLDYGNSIIASLRPGMVYAGGTDPGCFIPTMLNATTEGEQHLMLTQNALADPNYLNYLKFLYDDRLQTLTPEDAKQAFESYAADARKRQLHDQQFPDEPKQLRPGENVTMEDGHLGLSGQVAVMNLNERLLQTLMQMNPGMSFALEESSPLKATYPGAVPLGPIMELNAQGGQNAITTEIATQAVDYWRTAAQRLMADPEAAGSADTLLTYSHDAVAQANLLAAHDFNAQAEEAYRLASQLSATNFSAVGGLAEVFSHTGRTDQALQLLNDFAQKNPSQQKAVDRQRLILGIH